MRTIPDRRGVTLFEVVVALVIFTVTLPALSSLVQVGTKRAVDSAQYARASMECRSKLAEVTVGAEPLNSNDWMPLTDPNWFWKLNVAGGAVDGLKEVQVSVKFDPGASPVQVTLSQIIIDPAMRGSTQDRALLTNAAANSANNSSNDSSSGATPDSSSNSSSSSSTGGTTAPASGSSKTGAAPSAGSIPSGGGAASGGTGSRSSTTAPSSGAPSGSASKGGAP